MTAIERATARATGAAPQEPPCLIAPSSPANEATLIDRVAAALRRGAAGRRLFSITLAVPGASPAALLEALPGRQASLWDDGAERSAGSGVAYRLRAAGPGRFRELQRQARELGRRIEPLDRPLHGVAPAPARLYGGLPFSSDSRRRDPWSESEFILPRWHYRQAAGASTLTLHARAGDEVDELLGELGAILEAIHVETNHAETNHAETNHADARRRAFAGERLVARLADPDAARASAADFERLAGQALGEIEAGRFTKVVLARALDWRLEGVTEPLEIVRRLFDRPSDRPTDRPSDRPSDRPGRRFAFVRGGEIFLGATPERLVSRRGLEVRTEALAGTRPGARGGPMGCSLMESSKDRHEHQVVVEAITRSLGPLCSHLDVAPEPELLELPGLAHLRTPIRGRLSRPLHVLELAAALHPTPAVGGYPRPAATRWLARHEELERGWYAAPVGYFDAAGEGAGDGEFAVALRCGLLGRAEDGLRLRSFGGAGLVSGSVPEAECRESGLKQRALLAALGLAAPDVDAPEVDAPDVDAAGVDRRAPKDDDSAPCFPLHFPAATSLGRSFAPGNSLEARDLEMSSRRRGRGQAPPLRPEQLLATTDVVDGGDSLKPSFSEADTRST